MDVEAVALRGKRPTAVAENAIRALEEWAPDAILLQYVPQMWGAGRFGSFAPARLCKRFRARGGRVVAFAHELFLGWSARPDLLAGAVSMRAQLLALSRSADHLVVTTEERLEAVRALAPRRLGGAGTSLIPVGSNALPVPFSPAAGRFDIGLFSTLAAGKSFELVVDAFGLIARAVPGARLVLIGDLGHPSNPRHAALLQRISRHRASDRIVLTGKLPLPRVADAVACLDVFVFASDVGASTRSSTLPLPLGAGVPVVAFRGRDTGTLFVNRENVLFAPEQSPRALAEAVLALQGDPELRARLARGGRALYERQLAWDAIAERIVALLGGPDAHSLPRTDSYTAR